jgi:hypothetical protein
LLDDETRSRDTEKHLRGAEMGFRNAETRSRDTEKHLRDG